MGRLQPQRRPVGRVHVALVATTSTTSTVWSDRCRHLNARADTPNDEGVGEEGLEPSHPFGHRNLNPARLPIPPLARGGWRGYQRATGDQTVTLGMVRPAH